MPWWGWQRWWERTRRISWVDVSILGSRVPCGLSLDSRLVCSQILLLLLQIWPYLNNEWMQIFYIRQIHEILGITPNKKQVCVRRSRSLLFKLAFSSHFFFCLGFYSLAHLIFFSNFSRKKKEKFGRKAAKKKKKKKKKKRPKKKKKKSKMQ